MSAREWDNARALVSAEWLQAHLNDPSVFIFDATTTVGVGHDGQEKITPEREKFLAGHIPGAQFIDLQQQLSDAASPFKFMMPPKSQVEAVFSAFGVRADSKIVLYSTTSFWWATRVWWILKRYGFEQVYVLNGGFKYWSAQSYPTEIGEAKSRPSGALSLTMQPTNTITGDEILARLNAKSLLLVNALPKEKFSGQSAFASGRAGHIPGSINLSAASFVSAETGLLHEESILLELVRELRAQSVNKEVVAYCGGGVSATAIIFVLYLLGVDNVLLYDASMAEWAANERFPLATTI
jgi:thiosulfate/3-mercaptopyruvate sulfurtransferase